jgi:uncharacterized protein (TIGR03437 family)
MFRHSCFGLAIMVMALEAQTLSFFRQFSTPEINGATAVAADASGIYVFGTRRPGYFSAHTGAGVRKYDFRGNELWTREFTDSAYIWRAAADATGIYVLTSPGQPMVWLRKYSADGNELWGRQLDSYPYALAADTSGVYVAGGNYDTAYVRKYNPDGAELWTRRFGEIKTAAGVAVDATGVYVQVANSNGRAGVIVRKWDAAGNELWIRELNPSDVHRTFAAADPTGFYLVAADAWGTGTYLRKYDSGGNELWNRKISPLDFVRIAADATGVYLVGASGGLALPGHCRSGSGGDTLVRKYDPEGAEVWTRQFGTSQATWASGVAVNASGVYAVGQVLPDAFRDEWELAPAGIVETVGPGSAFLAKLDKSPAAVTGSGPRIFADCVVNAASYVGGGVAPGEIVTIFGSGMGPSDLVPLRLTENGTLSTNLADTRILFNGAPAPLVYVSDKQSAAIVPYAVAGRGSVDVQVEHKGVRSEALTMPVLQSRPGVFTLDGSGQGQGAILNEDGSINSPSNPARRGSIISIFGTGGGEAAPGIAEGQIVRDALPRTSLPVSVFFDLGNNEHQVRAKQGEVLYAGGVAGSVAGLLQINVRVPADAVDTGNAVPFALFIGSHWTVYQVTMALR